MSKKGFVLALTEARSWRPLGISALVIAGFLLVVGTFLGPIEAGEPTVTELLKALDLSGYPATMRPPEFSGQSPEGKMLSLADLRGKVVLLNFWATWCPDCRPEMPTFEQLHRDFATKGLIVLGVNVREGAHTVQSYAKELALTFPLVLDLKGNQFGVWCDWDPKHLSDRPGRAGRGAGRWATGLGERPGPSNYPSAPG